MKKRNCIYQIKVKTFSYVRLTINSLIRCYEVISSDVWKIYLYIKFPVNIFQSISEYPWKCLKTCNTNYLHLFYILISFILWIYQGIKSLLCIWYFFILELYYILIFYGNFGQIMVIDFQVNNVAHGPRLKTTDVLYSVHLLLSPHLTPLPDAPY